MIFSDNMKIPCDRRRMRYILNMPKKKRTPSTELGFIPKPSQYTSTEELVNELLNRHISAMVVMQGVSNENIAEYKIATKGGPFSLVSLMAFADTCVKSTIDEHRQK